MNTVLTAHCCCFFVKHDGRTMPRGVERINAYHCKSAARRQYSPARFNRHERRSLARRREPRSRVIRAWISLLFHTVILKSVRGFSRIRGPSFLQKRIKENKKYFHALLPRRVPYISAEHYVSPRRDVELSVKNVIAFREIEAITLIAARQPLVDINLALSARGCIGMRGSGTRACLLACRECPR